MRAIELTPSRPIAEVVELAAAAEDVGIDAVFVASHYNNRDPFATLSRVAAATTDVRLGPGVTNPYQTHPAALASRAATLQELAGGRAVFGIGAGDRSTLANLGYDRERPLSRLEEAVSVCRQLWAGERVTHDGTFVLRDAGLNYSVDPLSVYVGGQGPRMLRLAARIADGVLVNASHPRDVAWAATQLEEGIDDRPAGLGALESCAYAIVSIDEDGTAAREAARPPVAYVVSGSPGGVLDRHDIDRDRATRIGEWLEAGQFSEAFEAVTEPMLSAFAVAGTPEVVAERFEALLGHVDAVVAGSPLGPDPHASIDLLARAFEAAERD